MKKIYLFLVLSFLTVQVINAQTYVPEVINFMDLARYDAAHPTVRTFRELNEWDELLPKSFPLPAGAVVRTQNVSNTQSSTTPAAGSPSPTNNWGAYIDPAGLIPPDTHGCVGPNHVVTYTNEVFRIHAKLGGAVISTVSGAAFSGVAKVAEAPCGNDVRQ